MQKATPIHPPATPDTVEVNMTSVYVTLGALSVSTAGLAAASVLLWRKAKKNEEYLEAIREYVSRLVNTTECGQAAYKTLLGDIEKEEQLAEEEPPADWSKDESAPYPEQEPRRRRIREHNE